MSRASVDNDRSTGGNPDLSYLDLGYAGSCVVPKDDVPTGFTRSCSNITNRYPSDSSQSSAADDHVISLPKREEKKPSTLKRIRTFFQSPREPMTLERTFSRFSNRFKKQKKAKSSSPASSASSSSNPSPEKPPETTMPTTVNAQPIIVNPVDHSQFALCGIINHGNTCFINATVQCLALNNLIAEYLVMGGYFQDACDRVRANTGQTIGLDVVPVTQQLSHLIRVLWNGGYAAEDSKKFTAVIGHANKDFQSSRQQDAHEFFSWLLDKVHGDLTWPASLLDAKSAPSTGKMRSSKRNKSRTSKKWSTMDGSASVQELNRSFITETFEAQECVIVRCDKCFEEDRQYVPYKYISLPIVQPQSRSVTVNVVYLDRKPRIEKFSVQLKLSDSVAQLKSGIAVLADIEVSQLLAVVVDSDGFMESLENKRVVDSLPSDCEPFVLETAELPSSEFVHAVVVHTFRKQSKQENTSQKFLHPFVLQLSRDYSSSAAHQEVLNSVNFLMAVNSRQQELSQSNPFCLWLVDEAAKEWHVLDRNATPLRSRNVDRCLLQESQGYGPSHVKITVEWNYSQISQLFSKEEVSTHYSFESFLRQKKQAYSTSLDECIGLYTSRVELTDYTRDCSKCKAKTPPAQYVQFQSMPRVLVFQLKRFRQNGDRQVKVATLVHCPPILDMKNYALQPSADVRMSDWRYELFAICNHHGSTLNCGHYTAYCKHPLSGQWFYYDDQKVSKVSEEDIITPHAYIVFYQRIAEPASHRDVQRLHWSASLSRVGESPTLQEKPAPKPQSLDAPEADRRNSSVTSPPKSAPVSPSADDRDSNSRPPPAPTPAAAPQQPQLQPLHLFPSGQVQAPFQPALHSPLQPSLQYLVPYQQPPPQLVALPAQFHYPVPYDAAQSAYHDNHVEHGRAPVRRESSEQQPPSGSAYRQEAPPYASETRHPPLPRNEHRQQPTRIQMGVAALDYGQTSSHAATSEQRTSQLYSAAVEHKPSTSPVAAKTNPKESAHAVSREHSTSRPTQQPHYVGQKTQSSPVNTGTAPRDSAETAPRADAKRTEDRPPPQPKPRTMVRTVVPIPVQVKETIPPAAQRGYTSVDRRLEKQYGPMLDDDEHPIFVSSHMNTRLNVQPSFHHSARRAHSIDPPDRDLVAAAALETTV